MKTKETRKYVAARIDPSLLGRIDKINEKTRGNPRMVIEQCLEAHLPILEKMFGLQNDENGSMPGKDSSKYSSTDFMGLPVTVKADNYKSASGNALENETLGFGVVANRNGTGRNNATGAKPRRKSHVSDQRIHPVQGTEQSIPALHSPQ